MKALDRSIRHILLPLFAALAGLAGGHLRQRELLEAFDLSGLPIKGHPLSLALGVLAFLSVVFIFLKSKSPYSAKRRKRPDTPKPRPTVYFLLTVISSALLLGSGVVGLRDPSGGGLALKLMSGLSIFAAASILIHWGSRFVGRQSPGSGFFLIVPILYFCFTMVYYFRSWSSDPIILDYIYKLLALISTSLGLYGLTGFYFHSVSFGTALSFCLIGCFFSCIAIFDNNSLQDSLMYMFSALYMLGSAYQLLLWQEKPGPHSRTGCLDEAEGDEERT